MKDQEPQNDECDGIDKQLTTKGKGKLENPVNKYRLQSAKPSENSAWLLGAKPHTPRLLSCQLPCSLCALSEKKELCLIYIHWLNFLKPL